MSYDFLYVSPNTITMSEVKAEALFSIKYDLKELLKGGVQGKYAERYRAGTNLVFLAPDVAHAFPTEEAVNQALRLVMQLAKIPT